MFCKESFNVTIIPKHRKYLLLYKIFDIQMNIYHTEQNESKEFLLKKNIEFYQFYWELKNLWFYIQSTALLERKM